MRVAALVVLLALSACASHPDAPPPPSKVTLTYLGVAGWQISDGTHVILVDPYFSRPSPGADGPLVPDEAAIAARAPAHADLILVSHSHFDHALDVASVARRTGAQVLGSVSTAHLALAGGVPADHVITVQGGEDFQFDGFSVRVIPSLHAALDHKHTFGGASLIPADVKLPMMRADYLEGGTFAYYIGIGDRTIFISSTANFIERELVGLYPKVAIVGVGLREEIHDYTCRLVNALDTPVLVIANHFDAWREPYQPGSHLDGDTLADLRRFADEVHACHSYTDVIIPEHGVAIPVP